VNNTDRCEVRLLRLLLLAVAFAGSAQLQAIAGEQATLCDTPENAFFNCILRASGKVVSLCGSADRAKPWLQYRMGRPGQTLELVVPSRLDDPEMRSVFFYDLPSATRDGSYWQVGIWFRHADAYYELLTSQDHQYQEDDDDRSAVAVWGGANLNKRPVEQECHRTSSSVLLIQAGDVVKAMAPKWHHWGISPYDWGSYARKNEAHERAAAEAAGP
jgi:hypothetical protein